MASSEIKRYKTPIEKMNIDDLSRWFTNVPKLLTVAVLTRLQVQISDGSGTENSAFKWILIKIEVNLELIT